MGDLGPHNLDLPFEEHELMPMLDQDRSVLCGGMVVRSGALDVPEVGKCPTLIFTFYRADGVALQPIVFVTDDDQMAKARPMIFEAIASARRAAKGGR